MEEPKRKSFFDIVLKNISLADRSESITRFVYIGCYRGSKEELQQTMSNNVKEMNREYGEIVFTGLLLVYPKYFLHLIEASEETIYRHLQYMFNHSAYLFETAIALPGHYNIYKMYFTDWHMAYTPTPPVMLDKIEITELEEISKQIKNCLCKMYSLCEYLMDDGKLANTLKILSHSVPHLLPEVTILEYLLFSKSPLLEDLRIYLTKFTKVPFIRLYNECIWPPVWSFVPRYPFAHAEKKF